MYLEKSQERLQMNNYPQGDVGGNLRQRNVSCVGNCICLDAFTVELTAKTFEFKSEQISLIYSIFTVRNFFLSDHSSTGNQSSEVEKR